MSMRAASQPRLKNSGNASNHQNSNSMRLVSCAASSEDKEARAVGRQARREAETVAGTTAKPSNAAWRPNAPRTIERIYRTGHTMRFSKLAALAWLAGAALAF